jgi:hypothetical protein
LRTENIVIVAPFAVVFVGVVLVVVVRVVVVHVVTLVVVCVVVLDGLVVVTVVVPVVGAVKTVRERNGLIKACARYSGVASGMCERTKKNRPG